MNAIRNFFRASVGMTQLLFFASACAIAAAAPAAGKGKKATPEPPKARILIVTGQEYPGHPWKQTAPALAEALGKDPTLEIRTAEDPHFLDSAALERYDAVVLKTYGASRRQLIGAFVIEYAALGLAAAVFGVVVGSIASWFLAYFILEMPWSFSFVTAALTALIAMVVTVAAGLAVTWTALSARPAPYLRNE